MFTTSNCNIILLSLALGCFVSGSVVALLQQQEPSRRAFLARTASLIAAGSTAPLCIRSGDNTASAWAADDGEVFKRQTDKFSYIIKIPASMKQSQKPVKTHLDEINFVSETVKGYQYGITIDPVRITSLREVCSNNSRLCKVYER